MNVQIVILTPATLMPHAPIFLMGILVHVTWDSQEMAHPALISMSVLRILTVAQRGTFVKTHMGAMFVSLLQLLLPTRR